MTNRVFKEGRRLFQRKGRSAHWIRKGTRASPCGQLDLDFHKAKKVGTLAGYLPYDVCVSCVSAMERSL